MTRRSDVEFVSGARAERCRAWLYLPDATEPRPVLVMGHGLGAIKDMRLDAFAEKFSNAGYACLVFDYRHFGASEGEPRQLLDIGLQLEDWRAAIDYVRTLATVRTDQVILWGSSFGGGHVIATAADNPLVAGVIAQCPFTDGVASALALGFISNLQVGALAIADALGSLVGMKPVMVATSGPPRSAALMAAPDAQPGYLGLVPENSTFRNQVAARFGLQIVGHRPGRKGSRVTCPILFCICETDSVAPAGPTKRYAQQAPKAEVRLYQEGHFDIYVGDAFERVVADQLDFLKRHFPVALPARH